MNKLESLPPEIEFMECLTDLYLSANELLELPENIGNYFCCMLFVNKRSSFVPCFLVKSSLVFQNVLSICVL